MIANKTKKRMFLGIFLLSLTRIPVVQGLACIVFSAALGDTELVLRNQTQGEALAITD